MPEVLLEITDHVATVTWNAPDRLNAVTPDMLNEAAHQLVELDTGQVRVVVLTGAGRAFSAGANVADVDSGTLDAGNRLVRTIMELPLPVIARVNGVAAGIGASIALACDLVLASDKASFVLPFNRLGLVPDGGATGLLVAHAGRARALRIALLQEKIPAGQAAEWGLIASCVDVDEFDDHVAHVAHALAASSAPAMAHTKQLINRASLDLPAILGAEEIQYELLRSDDFREGQAAFVDKREPRFR